MKLLREYIRETLLERQVLEVVEVLEENALKKAAKWLKERGSSGRAKLKKFLEKNNVENYGFYMRNIVDGKKIIEFYNYFEKEIN